MKQVVPSDMVALTPHQAVENQGAAEQAEAMLERAGQLVAALKREDWQRLRRLGEGLAKSSQQAGHERVYLRARGVCRALDRPHNLAGIRRSLIELVGACGNAYGQLSAAADHPCETTGREDDCEDD